MSPAVKSCFNLESTRMMRVDLHFVIDLRPYNTTRDVASSSCIGAAMRPMQKRPMNRAQSPAPEMP